MDIYLCAIAKRRHWAGFRLDELKNRTLMKRIGYRYMPTYAERMHPREPGAARRDGPYLAGGRAGLEPEPCRFPRRVNRMGDDSWRYRNRLSFERELPSLPCG